MAAKERHRRRAAKVHSPTLHPLHMEARAPQRTPPKALRVFVCASHISSVYMTMHAQATRQDGVPDILFIDIGPRRKRVVTAIREVATMHDWVLFQDLSTAVEEDHRFEPGFRKRVTRRWKGLPVVRTLYGALLHRYERKRDARYRSILHGLLSPFIGPATTVHVHAHTETYLRHPLKQLFPSSDLTFFEHGQGDYIYAVRNGRPQGRLNVLFHARYRAFLERRGIDASWVAPLLMPADFPAQARALLELHGAAEQVHLPAPPERRLVLILLEAVDMYVVPPTFWGAYIDHVLSALEQPERYHFLLKPHPSQSLTSVDATQRRCRERDLSFSLLDAPELTGMAVEVLFAAWADRTDHVFCLVSTGCFYLSQLYRAPHIRYHYSLTFFEQWIGKAPPQYAKLFTEMEPLITEVLAERCEPY